MANRWIMFALKELEELRNGLGWSISEGCEIDSSLNIDLQHELDTEIKVRKEISDL